MARLADGRRDDVIVATKVYEADGVVPLGDAVTQNKARNSRRWIMHEVENSLRRLQPDWIDLHQVDPIGGSPAI